MKEGTNVPRRFLHLGIVSWSLLLFSIPVAASAEQVPRRNVVLIAGIKSHGPEGNGIHDYAWSVRLIKTMLEKSNVADQVSVTTFLNGWPSDSSALETADAVMVISDGRDGEKYREAPHLANSERVQQVDNLMARGCGFVTFHFSTFAPDALGEKALDWYGGYFDWETDGRRQWYSAIKTINAIVSPASPEHPILRGVKPFKIEEEFYYDIRFPEQSNGWVPVWIVDALPATRPNGKVVAWAVERENGSRGFATTCGHFYANWMEEHFRKTILNGIAWAANVEIPAQGIESDFYTHQAIARHLEQPDSVAVAAGPSNDDETVYADDPYWYKPGHPVDPANARAIKTLPGFSVDKVYTIPSDYGSWTAITVDDSGRLICAAQHRPGLYRVTLPATESDPPRVEELKGAAANVGWSHGLLYAFDSLYVTVSEANDSIAGGLYRLRDTDGDDQYDQVDHVLELNIAGEHGPHNVVVGPDGNSLFMMCGNGTRLPDGIVRYYPARTDGIDHLMPPGFESSQYNAAGFVLQLTPDGKERQVISAGLRNSFDLAFNHRGDLFTFDSDMEWDLGSPWYRPTRICHLVRGAEFGWRGDAAKWPEYYQDSVAPVVNVGPASPTGVVFGYGAKFPAKYQQALFACDWTFATIHAIHFQPQGATYRATVEEFVGGNGLPVTDLVIAKDGAMYFLVGGRRLGSALYRVRYSGDEPTTAFEPEQLDGSIADLHSLRRELEQYHGIQSDQAIDAAWPHLGHQDRAIRFAARVAVESQPLDAWRTRVAHLGKLSAKITGLLALARQEQPDRLGAVCDQLGLVPWSRLSPDQKLTVLRCYELALARGEDLIDNARRQQIAERLREQFPHREPRIHRELTRLLCFLRDREIIAPLLSHMAMDSGQRPHLGSGYFVRNDKYGKAVRDMLQAAPLIDRMHDAQMLLWIDDAWTDPQRTEYFRLIADATTNTRGGHLYRQLWDRIREVALDQVSDQSRDRYQAIAETAQPNVGDDLPSPVGPGNHWNLDLLLEAVQADFRNRDFENGRHMFAAAKCVNCHRFDGQGSGVGPDLTSLGQRFTIRDILDSTLNPSKAVSDQYRVAILLTSDGRTLTGRIVSRSADNITVAMNLQRPSQATAIPIGDIEAEHWTPVSTMPEDLLDPLNRDEVLDLLAYLISGADRQHPVFGE